MKIRFLIIGILIGLTVSLIAQGAGTPNVLRVVTDSNTHLMTAFAAYSGVQNQPTVFSNTRLRTDSNNNLIITDGTGHGFAPADATYITQTANATLTAEQALGLLSTGLLHVTTTTGVIDSIADIAAGSLLVSGTPSAFSSTPSITGSLTVTGLDLRTTSTDGLILQNLTAATVGQPVQISKAIKWITHALNSTSGLDEVREFHAEVLPATVAGTTTATFRIATSLNGGAITFPFSMNQSGALTVGGTITTGASSSLVVGTGGALWGAGNNVRTGSSANGLFTILSNDSGFGPQINTGTAAPTVTTCGTGAVTAHSSNTAGEVTATGATACTVTFGAPAWTNQPYCIIEDETNLATTRISAISTTAFTVTGLTSSDKFLYVCIGGI